VPNYSVFRKWNNSQCGNFLLPFEDGRPNSKRFEVGRVLVHFDHVTGVIINANHRMLKARCVAIHRGSTGTSVALIIAKTASPFLRFIRFTEPVVMIEVTGPAAVLMTISETTLSETICSIVPGKRLRMLVLMTLCVI